MQPRSRKTSAAEPLARLVLIPIGVLVAGAVGYRYIEGYSWLDAAYMTVITVTTVGYGEVAPLSPAGRMFTMALILGGVFILGYALTETVRRVAQGALNNHLGRNRMEKRLSQTNDHYIICGLGRIGRLVAVELEQAGVPFVAIDRSEQLIQQLIERGGIGVVGDATSDAVLRSVGIGRAKGVIALASGDADNLFITMSARLLNEKLFIVARAEQEDAGRKLYRAGATRVISPSALGGIQVAQAVLRPAVCEFIEIAARPTEYNTHLGQVSVGIGSPYAKRTLGECDFHRRFGITTVALRVLDGTLCFNPSDDTMLSVGHALILLCDNDQLEQLEQAVNPASSTSAARRSTSRKNAPKRRRSGAPAWSAPLAMRPGMSSIPAPPAE